MIRLDQRNAYESLYSSLVSSDKFLHPEQSRPDCLYPVSNRSRSIPRLEEVEELQRKSSKKNNFPHDIFPTKKLRSRRSSVEKLDPINTLHEANKNNMFKAEYSLKYPSSKINSISSRPLSPPSDPVLALPNSNNLAFKESCLIEQGPRNKANSTFLPLIKPVGNHRTSGSMDYSSRISVNRCFNEEGAERNHTISEERSKREDSPRRVQSHSKEISSPRRSLGSCQAENLDLVSRKLQASNSKIMLNMNFFFNFPDSNKELSPQGKQKKILIQGGRKVFSSQTKGTQNSKASSLRIPKIFKERANNGLDEKSIFEKTACFSQKNSLVPNLEPETKRENISGKKPKCHTDRKKSKFLKKLEEKAALNILSSVKKPKQSKDTDEDSIHNCNVTFGLQEEDTSLL